jgi:tRNA U34 5-methylaminomethyl-2-thiouridine-forming methyltransferase MnmC
MIKELIVTADGSHTFYLPELDEHYHSTYGAIQESLHIYINEGLLKVSSTEINILEIGFGTGLNAFLTAVFAKKLNLSVRYFSIEKYPLTELEYNKLNYPELIFPEDAGIFKCIHSCAWNVETRIIPGFWLKKIEADLLSYEFDKDLKFDLVYYDAFAPSKQPEMWSNETIGKICSAVKIDGILATYCAKGSVRRSFASHGFEISRIPGPAGKKEIIRGKKTSL